MKVYFAALSLTATLSACSTDQFASDDAGPTSDGAKDVATVMDAGGDAGTCGDCQGGACVSGVCQPVVLASGLNGPYGIALHGGFLYVTEFVPHGRVLRLDTASASQTPHVVATEAALATLVSFPGYVSKPFSIDASDADIFWTDLGGLASSGFTKLFRAATGSGTVSAYYELCAQGEVAVDAIHVFWANQATAMCLKDGQNGVFRGDLPSGGHSGSVYFPSGADGGAQVTPLAVGLSGNFVFVGAGNQLLIYDGAKINNPNGVTNALLGGSSALSATPYGIASDFTSVLWTDYAPNGGVYSLLKTAPPNTAPVSLAKNQGVPLGVTTDDGLWVYFTTYGAGQVMRVKKGGTATPDVVLSGLSHPAFLASNATTLFLTNFGSGSGDGTVMRVAKPN